MTSVTVVAALAMTSVDGAGQAQEGWTVPRTPDGRPDLQGIWANDSATPFQRPEALGNRETLTDEEVAAMAAHAIETFDGGGDAVFGDTPFLRSLAALEEPSDEQPAARPRRRSTGSYNQFWMIDRWFDNRTSLIVDPPNGRLQSGLSRRRSARHSSGPHATNRDREGA